MFCDYTLPQLAVCAGSVLLVPFSWDSFPQPYSSVLAPTGISLPPCLTIVSSCLGFSLSILQSDTLWNLQGCLGSLSHCGIRWQVCLSLFAPSVGCLLMHGGCSQSWFLPESSPCPVFLYRKQSLVLICPPGPFPSPWIQCSSVFPGCRDILENAF